MIATIKAALFYFAAVFALGFALGAVRVTFIIPRLGEFLAVLLELPIILLASWFVCGVAVHRYGVAPLWPQRFLMGAAAFGLTMAAEFGLSVFGFGNSMAVFMAALTTPSGGLGLSGQILFGLIPLIQIAINRPSLRQ